MCALNQGAGLVGYLAVSLCSCSKHVYLSVCIESGCRLYQLIGCQSVYLGQIVCLSVCIESARVWASSATWLSLCVLFSKHVCLSVYIKCRLRGLLDQLSFCVVVQNMCLSVYIECAGLVSYHRKTRLKIRHRVTDRFTPYGNTRKLRIAMNF